MKYYAALQKGLLAISNFGTVSFIDITGQKTGANTFNYPLIFLLSLK